MEKNNQENTVEERIAKRIARAGICSRRDAERLIAEGEVLLNGKVVTTPATKVTDQDVISVRGQTIGAKAPPRLWIYHKPKGLVTSHKDEKGRDTVFDHLPPDMPRVISVGRLDLNSEGLLLLTNDGELSRYLEKPASGMAREYRVRAFGDIDPAKLEQLKEGITVEGIRYGAIEAEIEKKQGSNLWLRMVLHEGKNREIRRVLEHLGLQVNRLIRVSYGSFALGKLPVGQIKEVPYGQVQRLLKQLS